MATASSIITEAFKLEGIGRPDNTSLSRATNEWLPAVLEDIASRKNWTELEDTKVSILTAYNQVIDIPSDFESLKEMRFYDGDDKDTAQAGSSAGITLAADEGITEAGAKGSMIFITSGTGLAEKSRIVSYNTTTKVAAVLPAWGTQPDATSTYMIANLERVLSYIPEGGDLPIVAADGSVVRVTLYDEEFYFDPIPDLSTYAVVMTIITHISQMSTSSSRYTNILTKWRLPILEGLRHLILGNKGAKASVVMRAKGEYEMSVLRLSGQRNRARWVNTQGYAMSRGGLPKGR